MANKAKKTPAGTWRVRVYDYTDAAGKEHVKSFTAPTKAAAELKAASFVSAKKSRRQALDAGTVGALVDEYIRLVEPTLSPSTVTAYRRVRAHAFPDLMTMPVARLTSARVQAAINAELLRPAERSRKPLTPKTLRNEWGVVSAALNELADLRFSPKLPTYQVAPKDLPDPAEVLAAVHGTDVELPVSLALCLSLTISEIRGLRASDFDGEAVTVRQVVIDTDHGPVVKAAGKTATRLRRVSVPSFVARLINESTPYRLWAQTGADGFLEPRSRSAIYGRWQTVCKRAGLSMSFHALRALNASAMLALGVPDLYAMQRGGWKSPTVMKKHYQQTLDQERRRVDQTINEYFDGMTFRLTSSPEKD